MDNSEINMDKQENSVMKRMIILAMTAATAVSAAVVSAAEDAVVEEHAARMNRAEKWYLPGRIGMFYHWGLYTGGGCRAKVAYAKPLKYPTAADFEKAAPDPVSVARNMVAGAKEFGATYTILTLWHTCGGHFALYPSKMPEFRNKSSIDYIAPYLDEAKKAGLHPLLYFPTDCNNWDFDPENPTMDPAVTDCHSPAFTAFLVRVLEELRGRYGVRIEGFWIDGGFPGSTGEVCNKIHALWPNAVVIGNNISDFRVNCDVSTSEICPKDTHASPAYNRVDTFSRLGSFGSAIAQRDLNEVDYNLAGWWYGGEKGKEVPYVKDPRLLVKEVVCALGQRGRWNATIAVGPRIDGTIPPFLAPVAANFGKFLKWAAPAVYGTKGPAGTFFDPGYAGAMNGSTCAAFYTVTQSLADPNTFYAIITERDVSKLANGKERANISIFQTNGHRPRQVTDLRTGRKYAFSTPCGTVVENIDFSDVDAFGATILKFEF